MGSDNFRTNIPAHSEMLAELNRYIEKAVVPIFAPSLKINLTDRNSMDFNARVSTWDHVEFDIVTNQGCPALLDFCMGLVTEEDILEVQMKMANVLFRSPEENLEIRRIILHFAVIFILLHELSHIICGHLKFCDEQGLLNQEGRGLYLDETDQRAPATSDSVSSSAPAEWQKLMELEADDMAFELLLEFAYEFLLAGDHFATLLPQVHDPNNLSEQMSFALGEMVVTACAVTFYLMEVQRGGKSDYPLPKTRLHNIIYAWARKTMVEDGIAEGRVIVELDSSTRSVLEKHIIPSCLNAAQFGVACAEVYCEQLPDAGDESRIGFDEGQLMDGFVSSLLVDNTIEGSVEIEEFMRLLPQISDLQRLLKRHPFGT